MKSKTKPAPTVAPTSLYTKYEKLLVIDKHNLDRHLIEQPQLAYEVSGRIAQATLRRDRLQAKHDQLLAELDVEVREQARKGVTETEIKRKLALHPEVVKLRDELAAAEQSIARWDGLRRAVYARGDSLRLLVDLLKMNYYAPDAA